MKDQKKEINFNKEAEYRDRQNECPRGTPSPCRLHHDNDIAGDSHDNIKTASAMPTSPRTLTRQSETMQHSKSTPKSATTLSRSNAKRTFNILL